MLFMMDILEAMKLLVKLWSIIQQTWLKEKETECQSHKLKKKSSDFCFTQYDTQNQLAKLSLGYVETFVFYIELFLLCESGTQDTGSDGETESLQVKKNGEHKQYN